MVKLLFVLFGFLKLGKVATTGGTMLLSLIVYGALYGWGYAAGFIGLPVAHVLRHYMAARRRGRGGGGPTLIPSGAAWIQLKEQPMNVEPEAYVAAAGPFVGTIAAT